MVHDCNRLTNIPVFIFQTIVDGSILTDRSVILHPNAEAFENFKKNRDIRVSPESIAEVIFVFAVAGYKRDLILDNS